jgi:hypothetical protein
MRMHVVGLVHRSQALESLHGLALSAVRGVAVTPAHRADGVAVVDVDDHR